MSWLALDIGGANLKAADGLGFATTEPFELWKHPEQLADRIAALIAAAPETERLTVTMTGELADCYPTKSAGVKSILDTVQSAAGQRQVLVYLTDGRFVAPPLACEQPLLAAASNWHALAAFANRFVNSWPALLLDMGSTTTDLIPLLKNGPAAIGKTDTERLRSGELVYTGVKRTPVCAVVRSLPSDNGDCPIAAEFFATSADAYLLLSQLDERPDDEQTADGRPFTREAARARLARMICADTDSISLEAAERAAAAIREAQLQQLERAADQIVSRLNEAPRSVIISGEGEAVLRMLIDRIEWRPEIIAMSRRLGETVSRCAPAHALAVLAREHCDNWTER
jgi:probable H4MPT-linked C1 transfer pathway protein